MGYRVAVIGATGVVGHEMLNILKERDFPVSEVHALASDRSAGQEVSFGDKEILKVRALSNFDFAGVDIVLASAGADIAKEAAPRAARAGALVIDNSSAFRMDPDVPLIVPEVNPDAVTLAQQRNLIANPNCSTIQMLLALKPLHDAFGISRVVVSTYQSVSGAGKDAMDELFSQTRSIFVNDPVESQVFDKRIAFNLLPRIDDFMDDGQTREEWKMVSETKKILDPRIRVAAHCVRVPVFIGHGLMVNVECQNELSAIEAKRALSRAPGCVLIDRDSEMEYVTPHDIQGEDGVYISRLREDPTVDNGLSFWCVADNLRKGAALNAVQIAELALRKNVL